MTDVRPTTHDPNDTRNSRLEQEYAALRERVAMLEQDLQRSQRDEELFRTACMSSPDYMAMIDRERRFVWANRTHPDLTMEEVLSRRVDDFESPDSLPTVVAAIDRGFRTRQPVQWDGKYSVNGQDGSASVRGVYLESRDCMLLVTTNTTPQVRAQQALEQSLEQLRANQTRLEAAHRIAKLGEWEWPVGGTDASWSPEMFRIFGKPPESFRPSYENYLAMLPADDRARVVAAIEEAAEHGTSFAIEHRVAGNDGHTRVVVCRAEAVRGPDGRVLLLRGTAQDVTDLRRIEESLRSALSEQTLLLQELQHRVKNNLQMVASMLALQLPRVDEPDLRRSLEACRGRVRAMALVHENLCHDEDVTHVSFYRFVMTLVAQLRSTYGDPSRHVLEVDVPRDLTLHVDLGIPCGLVVHELVTNALLHAFPAPESGTIRVAMRQTSPTTAVLVVEDDGAGLPATADANSEGLGWRIVQSLVKQIGGDLTRQRTPGTRVSVAIPLGQP